jgi:hypothetical protein
MRRALPLILIALTMPMLSGCFVELLTTTAIQGQLAAENAQAAQRQLAYARNSLAETQISSAIRMYQAEFGQYPPRLNALVPTHLPSLPLNPDGSPYYYDFRTGAFSPQPPPGASLVTPTDEQTMRTTVQAINLFARTNGQYPPTLQTLVTYTYLPATPTTESGSAFMYNPQTGELRYPDGAAGSTPRGNPARQGAGRAPGGYGQRQLDVIDELDL